MFLSAACPITEAAENGAPPMVMELHRSSPMFNSLNFSVKGGGNSLGISYYYVKVSVGTPPREYNLMVDTGSDFTWISCEPCQGCPVKNRFGIPVSSYSIIGSTSAMPLPCSHSFCVFAGPNCSPQNPRCPFGVSYEDNSNTTGYLVEDVFHFDTFTNGIGKTYFSASAIFGCSNTRTGILALDSSIDGILGLGRQRYSIISQLSSRGVVPEVISHCLRKDYGGILVLGEISRPDIMYSPLVPLGSHYNLYLKSITINGQILHIDPQVFGEIAVDSGTTLSLLKEEAYAAFNDFLTASVSRAQPLFIESRLCFQMPAMDHGIFPLVSFNFEGGASMVVRPKDYLIWRSSVDSVETWCSGFLKGRITVLGDFVLRDKIVIYDLGNQRIGWTEFDCSQPVNISSTFTYVNKPQRSGSHSISPLSVLIMVFMVLRLS